MSTFLDSLNIRKGLELEVEVADIFKIDIAAQGDNLAKEIFEIGFEKYQSENPGIIQHIIDSGGLMYNSKKEEIKISDTLIAYVYDSYLVDVDTSEDLLEPELIADHSKEIDFLNTEILTFDMFCENVMEAQRFTGKYKKSLFKFPFTGYGNFSFDDYLCVHKMIAFSNIQTLNFFITYKNVLSGIGSFVTGLYRNDVIRQREYLTSKEFATLLDEAERQFAIVSAFIADNDNIA